jgi:hypothetical protein
MESPAFADQSVLDNDIIAFNLQLEEIQTQQELHTGKWREDHPPDFAVAFADFAQEVRNALQIVEDIKLAQSLGADAEVEEPLLENFEFEELQARADRELARRLQQGNDFPSDSTDFGDAGVSSLSTRDVLTWSDVRSAMFERSLCDSDQASVAGSVATTIAGPSTPYSARSHQRDRASHLGTLSCVACTETFPANRMFSAECGEHHTYCKDCLKHIFTAATHDESRFPPRCCEAPIPLSEIENELSSVELKQYFAAVEEYSAAKRTYCANSECGKFVSSKSIVADNAHCNHCQTNTCVHCGAVSHWGDCPEDKALQAALDRAREEGWQRCYRCRTMVERPSGCNHMT